MSKRLYDTAKRAIDLVVSGAALGLMAPLLLAIALVIKLTSPGPVLFRQLRAGRHGVPFEIYKFRTMTHTPTADHDDLYSWVGGVPDDFVFKTGAGNELRITPVGRYLRRWSLDELPQLVNVWRGDMSLVGPRPELLSIAACYSPLQRRRLEVRPGITGWAQINGRSSIDHGRKIAADLYYVEHASFGLDLRVLARTVRVALTGWHAY